MLNARRWEWLPLRSPKPDNDSRCLNCQVEQFEIARSLGLGVFDENIEVQRLKLV
jgi:hypothetical protein